MCVRTKDIYKLQFYMIIDPYMFTHLLYISTSLHIDIINITWATVIYLTASQFFRLYSHMHPNIVLNDMHVCTATLP